jgi:Beta-propeller repeat
VIDPLLQATYLGGSGYDYPYAIALDVSGNVFVAGVATSTNFPGTTGGAQPANGGGYKAYVAKLNNGF